MNNMSTPVKKICEIFEERFAVYKDIGPGKSTFKKASPLTTDFFIKKDSSCEKHSSVLHGGYLNGATLSYAIEIAGGPGGCVTFTEDSVTRAEQIKDLFIASPMFKDVRHYLLGEEGLDKDGLEAKSVALRERFIREMAIEFNQVKVANKYVISVMEGDSTLDDVLEEMKSEYYSSWKNQKDYEWIASLPHYTENYIVREYAKLDV